MSWSFNLPRISSNTLLINVQVMKTNTFWLCFAKYLSRCPGLFFITAPLCPVAQIRKSGFSHPEVLKIAAFWLFLPGIFFHALNQMQIKLQIIFLKVIPADSNITTLPKTVPSISSSMAYIYWRLISSARGFCESIMQVLWNHVTPKTFKWRPFHLR